MAALAALLQGSQRLRHLLRGINALLSTLSQRCSRSAEPINGLLEALRIGPDSRQCRIGLFAVTRLREMLPRGIGLLSQSLGMGGEGIAIKGNTSRQHAAHRLAVGQELFEGSLTLAFR